MSKLKSNCATCGLELKLKSELPVGTDGYLRSYTCGHTFFEPTLVDPVLDFGFKTEDFTSLTGTKQAYDYQREGVEFIFRNNFNCMIADPMGLGKTIQALLAAKLARNADGTPRFKSILVLVKSATTYQWFEESKEWFSAELWSTFRISGTKAFIPPGFRIYVLSMDTFSRFASKKNGEMNALKALNIDLVIVDECHSFKNPESNRSKALVDFLQEISFEQLTLDVDCKCQLCKTEWQGKETLTINTRRANQTRRFVHRTNCPNCNSEIAIAQQLETENVSRKGLIMLSGTPIMNRADEYFIPLNLLRPDVFTSLAHFRRRWLQQDPETGKYNRIQPYMLEEFRRITGQFILRREKNQVLSLPPFRRTFQTIYIEDESLKTAYNRELNNLQSMVDNAHKLTFFDLQDSLMTLRRITEMAKVPFAVEYIDTFLDTTENEKIAIGIHHESVRDALYYALKQRGIKVLKLSGEDSAEQKNRVQRQFTDDPQSRVLIINMIAGGTGLNLQCCNNFIALCRQWNAAVEEQFEGRFNRPGQNLPVLGEYMLAHGTIDAWFSVMVEKKRQNCGETLDGWDFQSDNLMIMELVEKTLGSRL